MKSVDIDIIKTAHHRNGICGSPFKVGIFKDKADNSKKMFITFLEYKNDKIINGHTRTAVLDLDILKDNDTIEFGCNSWRGDWYHDEIIKHFKKEEEK
jgi:hypothetical protein